MQSPKSNPAIASCIFLSLLTTISLAQPANPNQSDSKGKRQGPWTLLMKKNWEETNIPDSARYYRLITYKNDKPEGLVRDYFKSTGKIQWSGQLLADRPDSVQTGEITFYSEDGIVELKGIKENNQWISASVFDEDGAIIHESADSLFKMGASIYQADRKQARVLYKRGMVRAKYEYGSGSAKYGEYVMNVTPFFGLEEGRRLCILVVTIFEDLGDPDNVMVGKAEELLGAYYLQQKQYVQAEAPLRRAVRIAEKVSGKGNGEYNARLFYLGYCLFEGKQNEKAKPVLQEARTQFASSTGRDNAYYISSTYYLANVLIFLKYFQEAIPLLEEIKTLIVNKPEFAAMNTFVDEIIPTLQKRIQQLDATALNPGTAQQTEPAMLKANQLRLAGDYEAAITSLLTLIRERESSYGPKSEKVAEATQELGLTYFNLARYDKATQTFEKVAGIYESLEGKAGIHTLTALSWQGVSWLWSGQLSKAEPLVSGAYQTGQPLKPTHPKEFDVIANNLGNFYLQVRNLDKAGTLFEECVATRKKLYGDHDVMVAEALHNLGLVYFYRGDMQKAEELFGESLTIFENTVGKSNPMYAMAQQNLSLVYQRLGKDQQSTSMLDEAFITKMKTLGPDHPDIALALYNMGLQNLSAGSFANAEVYLTMAVEKFGKNPGKRHPLYSSMLNNLATAKEMMHRSDDAEKVYQANLDLTYWQIYNVFPVLTEAEKKKFYDDKAIFFQNFGNFVLNPDFTGDIKKRTGQWYDMRLATKGLLFHASSQMRERIVNSGDPQLISQFAKWRLLRDSLTRTLQSAPGSTVKLEDEIGILEKEISKKSATFRKARDNHAYTWKEVQRELKPGEAAIEMIRLNKREVNAAKNGFTYHPAYVALIVRYDTKDHPELVVNENGQHLEEKDIRFYRNAIRFNIKDDSSYRVFWKPINQHLQGIKKIYFSPDGVYNLINLSTLLNTDLPQEATLRYLNDDFEIESVLSTKDLILYKAPAQQWNRVDLFGYPNYNHQKTNVVDTTRSVFNAIPAASEIKEGADQRFFTGDDIAELPGTKTEVENIRQILGNKSVQAHAYLYDDATEAALKKIENPQVLHIATHGYFLADSKKSSSSGPEAPINHPLMRSGLLFSGAKFAFQHQPVSANNDGVLTALEAMSLRLDQTQLVVLSACETGLGVISNGEGVYGLQRCFQLAGAKAVLMSLWTVPDQATQELMTFFYSRWLNGQAMRPAFLEAQKELRKKYPNAHDWGGFVLIGN